MRQRKPRPVGCRRCGSRYHLTKTHDGSRRHMYFREIPSRDPLGIARSSWQVNELEPRARPEAREGRA
jgi:hypothetical protein